MCTLYVVVIEGPCSGEAVRQGRGGAHGNIGAPERAVGGYVGEGYRGGTGPGGWG